MIKNLKFSSDDCWPTMHRRIFEGELEESGNDRIDTTPLRGNFARFPKLRLLDRHFRLDDVPKYVKPEFPEQLENPVNVNRGKWGLAYQSGGRSSLDRFIPQRRSSDLDASNYSINRESAKVDRYLDVLGQVQSLESSWRKREMSQAFEKFGIIRSKNRRILQLTKPSGSVEKIPGSCVDQPKDFRYDGSETEYLWPCRPRKRPVIGAPETVLDMPDMPQNAGGSLLDWSSTNLFASNAENSVKIFDVSCKFLVFVRFETLGDVCALKWNQAGDKMAVATSRSMIFIHNHILRHKIEWKTSCSCSKQLSVYCEVNCLCWSQDDKEIVTGCSEGRVMVYTASSGAKNRFIMAHSCGIYSMAFSSNYRYLATIGVEPVLRVFIWPELTAFAEYCYEVVPKAIAWHPWKSNILCVGGGIEDSTLTLWNVNSEKLLSLRWIKLKGFVNNLIWNKLSGELVVNWIYSQRRTKISTIPVFSNFNRVVDVLPVEKKTYVSRLICSPDNTQLATMYNGALLIWNFFGNDSAMQKGIFQQSKKKRTNYISANQTGFSYQTIR
ncbi:protein cortex [Orussus abietinus]|uniref:protein cortex n=1 Tax=Orussus abietinus TaxID=222816 RepID=UPI0006269D55|nr:protein cortex [Orussus abietinus]